MIGRPDGLNCRHRAPRFALVALLLCLSACKSSGNSEVHGVKYHLDLEGSYKVVSRNENEQVWVPSDDDRAFVSVYFGPQPRTSDGKAIPCEPETHSQGTAYGSFYFVRKGDSVDMVTAAPPHGVSVSEERCLDPGENALSCTANYSDGEMPPEREAKARAICASFALR